MVPIFYIIYKIVVYIIYKIVVHLIKVGILDSRKHGISGRHVKVKRRGK